MKYKIPVVPFTFHIMSCSCVSHVLWKIQNPSGRPKPFASLWEEIPKLEDQ